MKRNRFLHVLKVLAIVAVGLTVVSFVTKELWNWVMPAVFGLHTVTWPQALALLVLGKILFGGFRPRGGPRRQHMAERWARMTPEERERFQAGMRRHWDCGWNPPGEAATGQRPE